MKTFAVGDIHGGYKALKQCLSRSDFDYDNDRLICLGDVVDGWPETPQCIEELLKIKDLVYVIGNHDCLSNDTECLTNRGWLKYKEIKYSDKIYSFDSIKNIGVWTNINKIIIKSYVGELLSLKNCFLDLLCTPSHRVLFSKRIKKSFQEYEYREAKDLSSRIKIPVSSNSFNNGLELNDNEIMFIAWVLTDGMIIKRKDNHTPKYIIYQSKAKNIKHIKNLLKKLGYKYTEYIRDIDVKSICGKKLINRARPQHSFNLLCQSGKEVAKYFDKKYPFPTSLFDMSGIQFKLFLKEIIRGDGSVYNRGRKGFILYGEKLFLDNIQRLCLTNGYRATITKDTRGCYRLNIGEYNTVQMDMKDKIKKVKYNGDIWCLSVPLTNFMVRRNGKAFFTGNCWTRDWFETGATPMIWTEQGGKHTIKAYIENPGLMVKHKDFFKDKKPYYIDDKKRLFVHGGFKPNVPIEEQTERYLTWDRALWDNRYNKNIMKGYKGGEVFVGHTSIWHNSKKPICFNNVWFLDTGGGYEGKLSLMNIDSHEVYQSDLVFLLYPEHSHR